MQRQKLFSYDESENKLNENTRSM